MKLEIKGPIISDSQQWIYDWFEIPATSPGKVNKALSEAPDNEELEVIINSGGGSVFSGSEIYTALKEHKGEIKGKIVGLAASAASVIAMGIKNLEISPTAQIMIHKASTWGEGNAEDFQKTIDALNGIDRSIANAYLIRTGIKKDELLNMMSKETWLSAEEAKQLGFVDKIMFEDEFDAVASISLDSNGMIPEKIINKLMEEFKDKAEKEIKNQIRKENNINNNLELSKAKLKLAML